MILHNTNSEKLNRAYYNKQLEMAKNLLIIIVFNEKLLKLLIYNVELYGAATSNGSKRIK